MEGRMASAVTPTPTLKPLSSTRTEREGQSRTEGGDGMVTSVGEGWSVGEAEGPKGMCLKEQLWNPRTSATATASNLAATPATSRQLWQLVAIQHKKREEWRSGEEESNNDLICLIN